jgi:hypothetical protein
MNSSLIFDELDAMSDRDRAISLAPKAQVDRVLASLDVDPETGCHTWTGYTDPDGYGLVRITYAPGCSETVPVHRLVAAHSLAWWLGPADPSLLVHHWCENRTCARPEHLGYVTHEDHRRWHSTRGPLASETLALAPAW